MSEWWIINARHEVVKVKEKLTEGEDGHWFVDGEPGWFYQEQNLFDNEEDAKLRAIERVLGYALERGVPVREQYVRTACAYAKEFRERVKELERGVERAASTLLAVLGEGAYMSGDVNEEIKIWLRQYAPDAELELR